MGLLGKSKKQVEEEDRAQAELDDLKKQVKEANDQIDGKKKDIIRLDGEKNKINEKLEAAEERAEKEAKKAKKKINELEEAKEKEEKGREEANKEIEDLKKNVAEKEETLKKTKARFEKEKRELDDEIDDLEAERRKLKEIKHDLQDEKEELEGKLDNREKVIKRAEEDANASRFFVDCHIDSCEFARAFPYFITVQLGDDVGNPRSTETSISSQFPSFETCSFLLPFHNEPTESQLILRAHVVVNPNDPL